MTAPTNLDAVRDALHNAEEPPIGAPPAKAGERFRMPEGCPVEPLGVNDNTNFYLGPLGEMRALKASEHGRLHLAQLFGGDDEWLLDHYPKFNADGDPTGKVDWDKVAHALMRAAADCGVWSPADRVRGRGAWADRDGGIVLHCGDHVLYGGEWRRPGVYDRIVYPAAPAIPRPQDEPALLGGGASIETLTALLASWNWERPDIGPALVIGWVTASLIGAGHRYRPVLWLTGDKATGKSTLDEIIEWLLGGAVVHSSDATEAAVRQILGHQTLPVVLDEAEAEEDNRRMNALIKLARISATGGKGHRGGADHKGTEFVIQSGFKFSSILIPPMPGQDRSRMAILDLKRLPQAADEPSITEREANAIGRWMRRRLADSWPRWAGLLAAFRRAMMEHGGHSGRGADQFGTLAAGYWLMTQDAAPGEDELALWGERLSAKAMAETEDEISDAERCVAWLGSSLVQLGGGGVQRTVADWVQQAVKPNNGSASIAGWASDGEAESERRAAINSLAKVGLTIVAGAGKQGLAAGVTYLCVASAHQGLAKQFEGSHWQGRSGASGVWSQALVRVDDAVKSVKQRIGGMSLRCTAIPVSAMLALGEDSEDGGASAGEPANKVLNEC
jgi:hypothetical protein